MGLPDMGLLIWLLFEAYLRPSEGLLLHACQVVGRLNLGDGLFAPAAALGEEARQQWGAGDHIGCHPNQLLGRWGGAACAQASQAQQNLSFASSV